MVYNNIIMDTINNLYIVLDKNNKLCKIDLVECDTYIDYIPVFTPIEDVVLPSFFELKSKNSEFYANLVEYITSDKKIVNNCYENIINNLIVHENSREFFFAGCEKGHIIKPSLHIFKPFSYNHYFYGHLNGETLYNNTKNKNVNIRKLVVLYAGIDFQIVEIYIPKCIVTKPFYDELRDKYQVSLETTGITLKNISTIEHVKNIHSRIDELESEIIVCLENSDTKIQEFVDKHSHKNHGGVTEDHSSSSAPYYSSSSLNFSPVTCLSPDCSEKLQKLENKIRLMEDQITMFNKMFDTTITVCKRYSDTLKEDMNKKIFEQQVEIQSLKYDYSNMLCFFEENDGECEYNNEEVPEIYNISGPLLCGLLTVGFFVTILIGV